MIEELYSPKTYPRPVADQIEQKGSIAISIANRWLLGCPILLCLRNWRRG